MVGWGSDWNGVNAEKERGIKEWRNGEGLEEDKEK